LPARFFISKSLSLSDVVPYCLDPIQFVTTHITCAGIQSTSDWVSQLGHAAVLESACRSDLTDRTACDKCVSEGLKVQAELTTRDGNSSHSLDCWYVTIVYAAGVVNEFGPEIKGTLSCIFGLSLESDVGFPCKNHKLENGVSKRKRGQGSSLR
ncbi:hypothetical protein TorRG33x02_266210, partial [Trema orientale]